MYRTTVSIALITLVFTGVSLAVPGTINYQGKVEVGGEPFDGTGGFQFAIVDDAGTYYWSNDGMYPPTYAIALLVTDGLFSVTLGSTGMTSIPATVFDGGDRYLRVWFNDQVTGWQQLSPDQLLSSVPYSLKTIHAELADTVDGLHADELTRARGSLGINYCIALVGTYPPTNKAGDDPTQVERGTDPYIGEIMLFAGNFPPQGWAFCNGQILSIAQNTALFSLLGTTFGGDGETTFGLPDLRGRVPLGVGNGPGGSAVSWGQMCGTPGCAE